MKRIVKIAQGVGERVRNRMRSGSHRVMELRAPAVARYRNGRRNDCRKATNNYSIRLARLSRKRNELLRKWTMASKRQKRGSIRYAWKRCKQNCLNRMITVTQH